MLLYVILNLTNNMSSKNQPFSKDQGIRINLVKTIKINKPLKKPKITKKIKKAAIFKKKSLPDKPVEDNIKKEPESVPLKPADESTGINQKNLQSLYLEKVYKKIESNKSYPLIEKKRNHEGSVKIGFIILRDGSVKNINILKGCKYEKLNQAAVKTINKAVPFLAFPVGLKQKQIVINIEIVYEIE